MRPGDHGAAARDREHVFDRHQERLIDGTLRQRDVGVERVVQLEDRLIGQRSLLAVERLDGRTADDRNVVAGELVLRQQLAHLQLDQVEQLGVVHHVALVDEHHDVGHAYLAGEQDVLAGLRHRAVDRRHDQDGAVHLGGTGDHVLDVVGVARAVDMGIVPVLGAVFDVARGNRQNLGRVAAALRFGGLRHLVIGDEFRRPAFVRRHLGQRRGQRRLAMVDVADRADVAMGFGTFELLFGHRVALFPSSVDLTGPGCAGADPAKSWP